MSGLGSFGYFAGGLSSGFLSGKNEQRQKQLADAQVQYQGKLGEEAGARSGMYGADTARINNHIAALKDYGKQLDAWRAGNQQGAAPPPPAPPDGLYPSATTTPLAPQNVPQGTSVGATGPAFGRQQVADALRAQNLPTLADAIGGPAPATPTPAQMTPVASGLTQRPMGM